MVTCQDNNFCLGRLFVGKCPIPSEVLISRKKVEVAAGVKKNFLTYEDSSQFFENN